MIARLLALVLALCFAGAAKADIPWTAASSNCLPDDATIKFDRYKASNASVEHASGNVDLVVLTCPVSRFPQTHTDWDLQLTYRDSTGTNAQAFVRARLYRMRRGQTTPDLLATVSSNSSPITSNNQLGSGPFGHTFDFDGGYAYWVRVELERATTNQTVIFYSIALEEVFFSDIRLKHNVALLGQLDNGLGFYRFSYIGSDAAYVGVMAQEVQAIMPEAVVRGSDGYLRVFYDLLGLRMQPWDKWVAAGGKIPTTAASMQQ